MTDDGSLITRRSAFTLIELLVVIAIISILARLCVLGKCDARQRDDRLLEFHENGPVTGFAPARDQ